MIDYVQFDWKIYLFTQNGHYVDIWHICGTHVTLSNLTNMIIVSEIDHLDIIDYDYYFFDDVENLNKWQLKYNKMIWKNGRSNW
jgi:hypothetical protein